MSYVTCAKCGSCSPCGVLTETEQERDVLKAINAELIAACRAALSLGALGESIGIADAMDRSSAKATARLESVEAQILAAIAKAEGKT